jgi:uncharacterized protein
MERERAFLQAVRHGEAPVVRRMLQEDRLLVEAVSDGGASALALAARLGQTEVVRLLLAAGAATNPREQLPHAPTALMEAAADGHDDIAALLLEHGADPSLRDHDGRDAVAHARANGHAALAARLGGGAAAERTPR